MELFRHHRSKVWSVDLGYYNGKRIRRSTGQTTKSAAQTVAAEMDKKLKAAHGEPASLERKVMPTLQQFADAVYLPYVKAHTSLKPKSKDSYENGTRLLKNTVLKVSKEESRPYAATTLLSKVTSADVKTLKVPGGPSNCNQMRRALRNLLSLAVEKEYIVVAPRIHLMKERKRKAVYDAKLEQKIMELAPQPLKDIFLILFDAGMRPDEIIRLEWQHILWDEERIFVDHGKTSHATRRVPLSDRVREALLERLRTRKPKHKDCPWVFPSVRKSATGHITDSGFGKQFRALRAATGFTRDLVLYCARHTFCTDFYDGCGNAKLTQEVMGHGSLAVTQIYIHPDHHGMDDVINARNRARAERAATTTEVDVLTAGAANFGRTFGRTGQVIQFPNAVNA